MQYATRRERPMHIRSNVTAFIHKIGHNTRQLWAGLPVIEGVAHLAEGYTEIGACSALKEVSDR